MAKAKVSPNYMGKNPRKAKKERQNNRCPVCGAGVKTLRIDEMNFRSQVSDNKTTLYWCCANYPACDTYIGANPQTKQMDGIIAGPQLRHKRMALHAWERTLGEAGIMSRSVFWEMCAGQIGIHRASAVHARYLTEFQCDTILSYLQKLYENRKEVQKAVDAKPFSIIWKQVRGINTQANHGIYYNQDGSICVEKSDPVALENMRKKTERNGK